MKRLILTSPTGLTVDQLTPEQQVGISSVFTQYIMPMPGTISYGTETYTITTPDPESTTEVPLPDVIETFTGTCAIDAVTNDNCNPALIESLEVPFTVLGVWEWTGNVQDKMITLQPLSTDFVNYLPDINTYDEEGIITSTTPPTLTIPHNWSGWSDVVL